ncbi:DNA-3-methyladenine glycosylase I [Alkalibacter mobilis]|uniref:DNA-3-methyladenine glycosylase I n=1 Tax=Alkalibacter mobilis TaxID=2787712 RepID=UPI00189C622E|nr:DNA-3-methyladenine glycosylase I [Alkalibacter mobilis]MBF7096248.1 DNA-3-methyladenine glycosylase I [Alkalibacter mobilis]
MTLRKCSWCLGNDLYEKYHDFEWGAPVHDDLTHFEFLVLESAQAGLSWLTILKKRENYRKAYDNFDYKKIACYGSDKIEKLMNDPGIIRNRRKIEASVTNAVSFIKIQNEFGSFDSYMRSFTGDSQIVNKWDTENDIPAFTELSKSISLDLKKRGFKFLGPTIVYSHMQATGFVNDHVTSCFRYKEILELKK